MSVSIAIAAAEADPALLQRIAEVQNRLDHFIALFSAIGTWAGFGLATITLITGSFIGLAGYFGWREVRSARKAYRSLGELTARNKAAAEILETRIKQDESRITSELAIVQGRLVEYEENLRKRVDDRIRVVRDLIAGELCYRNSDFEGALKHFSDANSKDPTDREVSYYLGRTLTYRNEVQKAVEVFENLLNESDPRPLRGLALALRFHNPRRALEYLDQAVKLAASDRTLYSKLENERGLIFRDLEEYEHALACHRAALSHVRYDTVSTYFVGIAELLCHRDSNGRQSIERAAANAMADRSAGEIKPIWAAVIAWSAAFVRENSLASVEWDAVRQFLSTPYISETVMAHVRALSKACDRPAPVA